MQFIAVTTTSDDKSVLESIAKQLVEKELAACVQISGPIESWYSWEGEVRTSTEWQCLIKSSVDHFRRIKAEIIKLHNYDLPQIAVYEIATGSQSYLVWMAENLTTENPG